MTIQSLFLRASEYRRADQWEKAGDGYIRVPMMVPRTSEVAAEDENAADGAMPRLPDLLVPHVRQRASEVQRNTGRDESTGRDQSTGAAANLLVPHIRQGLEYVLEGGMFGDVTDDDLGPVGWIPVRAFEVIAGERGRIKDGRLQRWYGTDRTGDVWAWTDIIMPALAPWREAWERQTTTVFYQNLVIEDGPVWLVGPTVMGNFYGLKRHELRRERELTSDLAYEPGLGIESWFAVCQLLLQTRWGIEWRLGDEPVARVMRSEMGLEAR